MQALSQRRRRYREGLTDGCAAFFPLFPKTLPKENHKAPGNDACFAELTRVTLGVWGAAGAEPTWAAAPTNPARWPREGRDCELDLGFHAGEETTSAFDFLLHNSPSCISFLPLIPQSSIFCHFSDSKSRFFVKRGEFSEQTSSLSLLPAVWLCGKYVGVINTVGVFRKKTHGTTTLFNEISFVNYCVAARKERGKEENPRFNYQ